MIKEGECLACLCMPAGEMLCEEKVCPMLNCAEGEIEAFSEDVCCPYCDSDWVEVGTVNTHSVENASRIYNNTFLNLIIASNCQICIPGR